ncbi:hypothetical protein DFS33DRAFT_1297726 [Desarmillaria ectypa]|nr:hypothetical protein DFS33DRAFT_1297726 [Desarmillaria ectypa]
MKDAQNTHEIILSPIRRLHLKILVQIFLATYDSYLGECGDYNVFDVTSGPSLVGTVWSKWRAVVLSHSTLWSTMHFRTPWVDRNIRIYNPAVRRRVAKLKGPIPLLSSALSRSRQHGLSFNFKCYDHSGGNIPAIMSTLFHLL